VEKLVDSVADTERNDTVVIAEDRDGHFRLQTVEPSARGLVVPCFWSATSLVVLHWLSAAILRSLWFDYPCVKVDLQYDLGFVMIAIIGFQIALWFGNAEYLLTVRQMGMKQWWMWSWVLIFLMGLWDVPTRVFEDIARTFEDASFIENNYSVAKLMLSLFVLSHLPIFLWLLPNDFIEKFSQAELSAKLWRVRHARLSYSLRALIFVTAIISFVVWGEVQHELFSMCVEAWVFVGYFLLAVFVRLATLEQSIVSKANRTQLLFCVGTGILNYFCWGIWIGLHPIFQSSWGHDFIQALPILFIGYYFGRLLILVVRFFDQFPPTLNRDFLAGRISWRTKSGVPAFGWLLLILFGTHIAWYAFSTRYQPSVLVCATEEPFEYARVVARSSQLHRSIPLDKDFETDHLGRFFEIRRERGVSLFIAKAVARDIRWVSLSQESEAHGFDITWVHDYPQDNPVFFDRPHVSPLIDIDAISPGSDDRNLIVTATDFDSRKVDLFGGTWTTEMVEVVRKVWPRYLGLFEPKFAEGFSSNSFSSFQSTEFYFRTIEPVINQPDLYSDMMKAGSQIFFILRSEDEVNLAVQRLSEMPQFANQLEVSSEHKVVLIWFRD